jgi:hypothetical protein
MNSVALLAEYIVSTHSRPAHFPAVNYWIPAFENLNTLTGSELPDFLFRRISHHAHAPTFTLKSRRSEFSTAIFPRLVAH